MGPSCQSVVEITEKKRKKVEEGVREKSEMRNSSHVEPESGWRRKGRQWGKEKKRRVR